MTLHLLKDASNPLALAVLSSQPSTQSSPPVVVMLSPTVPLPSLTHCSIYRLQEQPSSQEKDAISYPRLVELIFQAEKVIAW